MEDATAPTTPNARAQVRKLSEVLHLLPKDSTTAELLNHSTTENIAKEQVILLDGDVQLGQLDLDNPAQSMGLDSKGHYYLIIVQGNLSAKNIYNEGTDVSCGLIVLGDLNAVNIVVGGQDIYVSGKLSVEELFWGDYSHGAVNAKEAMTAKVLLATDEYHVDTAPEKITATWHLDENSEGYKPGNDLEELTALARRLFREHHLEDPDEDEDWPDWNSVISRYTILKDITDGLPVLSPDFSDGAIEKEPIPHLFRNTEFQDADSFHQQYGNFQQLLSYFRDEADETFSFRLPEIHASVLIAKDDGIKGPLQDLVIVTIDQSNGVFSQGDGFMIWRERAEAGVSYDFTHTDGSPLFAFLYHNPQKGIEDYCQAFELFSPETLQNIWQLLLGDIEKGIYYKQQFEDTVTANAIDTLLQMPMVLEKFADSWDNPDDHGWIGNACYSFRQESDEAYPTIKIIKEIRNTEHEFDAESFYYLHDTGTQAAELRYYANYHKEEHPLYEMRYSNGSDDVPFYHYRLYQDALKHWKKAVAVLPRENGKYLQGQEELKKMAQKIMEARTARRQTDHAPAKPYETVTIDGIRFTLKERMEAEALLDACTDFDGNPVYDAFAMDFPDDGDEDEAAFFLVAETEVTAEKLRMDTRPDGLDELIVLGFIFLQPITIDKYLEADDIDYSPALICLDDAYIGSAILYGTTHYFHKDLNCINLYGFYNHGSLIVKGAVDADFIYAYDFNMQLGAVTMVAAVTRHDGDIQLLTDISLPEEEPQYALLYLPGTNNVQDCLQDRFIHKTEDGYEVKDDGMTGENQYAAGEDTFFDYLRRAEPVHDFDKMQQQLAAFQNTALTTAQELFATHAALKDLPKQQVHYISPSERYDHRKYYFQQTDAYYMIGYWNEWYHFSASCILSKSGNAEEHDLIFIYWDKENTIREHIYPCKMDSETFYRNICMKVFYEAIELLQKEKSLNT